MTPSADAHRDELSHERLAAWRERYLQSANTSFDRATSFQQEGDHFSAYLYLYVAFNNLYRLRGGPLVKEREAIKDAVDQLNDDAVESIYTNEYFLWIGDLNDRYPADVPTRRGIVNMLYYFAGFPPEVTELVAHLGSVARPDADLSERKATLGEVACKLLYTVRNNQFHAVKSPADEDVLRLAYKLLAPIVRALQQAKAGRAI